LKEQEIVKDMLLLSQKSYINIYWKC
jgi:hypothetical protein